ncbi:basic salivary proline-rich protein 2-like [Penaeus monodon]|uniref:basic salivary proline-rich protein 2-like n=1 Tax=Penaeus monodon TaxID=6687 RepID=UPI0018A75884|nr:basic salivary proline-rich protein 2-like [Penaeus monodon]
MPPPFPKGPFYQNRGYPLGDSSDGQGPQGFPHSNPSSGGSAPQLPLVWAPGGVGGVSGGSPTKYMEKPPKKIPHRQGLTGGTTPGKGPRAREPPEGPLKSSGWQKKTPSTGLTKSCPCQNGDKTNFKTGKKHVCPPDGLSCWAPPRARTQTRKGFWGPPQRPPLPLIRSTTEPAQTARCLHEQKPPKPEKGGTPKAQAGDRPDGESGPPRRFRQF